MLTDGEDNSAYWEHRWIAEHLGIPLAVPADLEVRDGEIHHLGEKLDAIYRRTNADEVDSEVGRLLHPAVAAGALKLVNCFGTGVADDKLAHAYVEDMVRFYLGEEPPLEQVETFDLGDPAIARARARRVRRAGDQGPRLLRRDRRGRSARTPSRRTSRRCASRSGPRRATTSPSGWSTSRPTRPRSTAQLEPRHVDLRPFVLMVGTDDVAVLPGGMTRVALDEGALVVNSSQNGGAKDTWVVP